MADDPRALYPHVNGDLRAAYSENDFAAAWNAQSPEVGRVTEIRRTSMSERSSNELGFVYVTATYDVRRVRSDGSSETGTFDVFFVREGDEWRVLFSRQR